AAKGPVRRLVGRLSRAVRTGQETRPTTTCNHFCGYRGAAGGPALSDVSEAASVLLTRGRGSPQVFAVRRSESLRFFGGFIAFPGGRVSPADAALDPATDARRVAAARELFEETGVLVARRPDGTFPAGDGLNHYRRE